jgi:hypothetical protein
VALAGESIHCQYFKTTHGESGHHSTVPADEQDHVIHCLVANHSGSIAVESHTSHLLPALTASDRIAADDHLSPIAKFPRTTSARAPPLT